MQHKDNNREFNDLYRRFDEAMSKVDLPDKGQLMSLIASHSEVKPSRRRLWVAVAAAVAALVVATFAVNLFFGGENNNNSNLQADTKPQPSLPSTTKGPQGDSVMVAPTIAIDNHPLAMNKPGDDSKTNVVVALEEERLPQQETSLDIQYADNNSDSVVNEPLATVEPIVLTEDSTVVAPAENKTNQYPRVMNDSRSDPSENQRALQNCRKRKNRKANINNILNQESQRDRDVNVIIMEKQQMQLR